MEKSYLFYNGKVLTLDSHNSIHNSILTIGNKIVAVGDFSKVSKLKQQSTELIDLNQKIVLPGFVDSHTHFYELAKSENKIYLGNAKSVSEIEDIFRDSQLIDSKWIQGYGWDLNRYPDATNFNIQLLDKYFPNVPISIKSHDFHTLICNSVALKILKLNSKTEDPKGGKLGRNSDGSLTGFLHEKAWELVAKIIPNFTKNESIDLLTSLIKKCWEMGLTGAHDMVEEFDYDMFDSIEFDKFPFRHYIHFPASMIDKMINNKIKCYTGGEKRKLCGMKIFMDGALGSHTALMYKPYPNQPENFGTSIYSKEELFDLVYKGASNNISSAIHGIGEKAIDIIIDVFDKVNSITGILPHRIEHFQCANDNQFEKVIKNKIICSVQPIHMKEDIPNIEKIWPDSAKYTYSFKSQIDKGICLAFGSDAPIETINPMEGIYSALTRKAHNNPENPSWRPDQKLSIWDALKGYTINSAKSSQSEKLLGTLEKGKLADMIVLDNFFDKDDTFWLTAKSRLTMVNGKIVFENLSRSN